MKRRVLIYAIALALFTIIMAITWGIGTHDARTKTEALLDFAVLDLYSSVEGSIDAVLWHSALDVVRKLGSVQKLSLEEMAEIAEHHDIDELNVVDRTGLIVSSNDPTCLNVRMGENPATAPFLQLTDGKTLTVSQPFRTHAHNPKVRAKYLGVAFPDGDGYIEVGLYEHRLGTMMPAILGYIFEEWIIGRTGFYLCANPATGRLLSNPARHKDEARTIFETGYDLTVAAPYESANRKSDQELLDAVSKGTASKETFEQRLFGEKCRCRAFLFGEHRFVAAVPDREYFSIRNKNAAVLGGLLFVVLGLFTVLLDRISCAHDAIQAFYAAEDERRAKDMRIAATIQESELPQPLAKNPRFELEAKMQTARDVGGDFYDFFMLDATHVAFLVADVSGKGITAALYMMTAKTLIKDTLLGLRDPATALTRVNHELCQNNAANMFLTAWVGVLDLDTGVVTYANAGHNPPVRLPSAEFIPEKSGPVLAFMDSVEYKPFTLTLEPGDSLFLYTDGVTEATDAKNELFGEERLVAALKAAITANPSPTTITSVTRIAVSAFVEGMPQADDITMLAIRRLAPPAKNTRAFQPTQEGIAQASEFLDETLPDLTPEKLAALHIILDELTSNIVRHAKATAFKITLKKTPNQDSVMMVFADDGIPFNPLKQPEPDTTLPAEERPIGGLGIMMVRKMASKISYHRAENQNILIVKVA